VSYKHSDNPVLKWVTVLSAFGAINTI